MAKLPPCSEYVSIMETPALLKATILKNGHVIKQSDTVVRYVGGFCVVFPYQTTTSKHAIRCWHANIANAQERSRKISDMLRDKHLPYFVNFDYIPEGVVSSEGIQPVVVMDWVEAKPLKGYIAMHLHESNTLRHLAEEFKKMVQDLHAHELSHGDLQHGNMLVKDNGKIIMVDYDSMYVPTLSGFRDEIKGLEGYQHEARWANRELTPKADYFSELVIYTSLIALSKCPRLWHERNIENTETLLFTGEDIKSKGTSEIFRILDQDNELAVLSRALQQAMQCRSIEELSPLEEVIHSPIESIGEKRKVKSPKAENIPPDTNNIQEKWNKPPLPSIEIYNIESITKKW